MGYVDVADIRDYGAVSSPPNAPVMTTASVQEALDSGKLCYIPPAPAGEIWAVGDLYARQLGCGVFGEGQGRSKLTHFGSGSLFHIMADWTQFKGFTAEHTNSLPGSSTFYARTDLGHLNRCEIEDIFTFKSRMFFKDANHPTNRFNNVKFRRDIMAAQRGHGFDMRNLEAYIDIIDTTCDFIGGNPVGHMAFQMRGNRGSHWMNVDITNGIVDLTTVNNHGFFFDDCQAVDMIRTNADSVGGHGYYIYGRCQGFNMIGAKSSLVGGHPLAVGGVGGGCTGFQITAYENWGRAGQAYAPANKPAFYAAGANKFYVRGRSENETGPKKDLFNCGPDMDVIIS